MPQQHFQHEDDAKQAARMTGLTDSQFEVVSGPKGFSFRKKKQYKKVEKAKLHVGKDPEKQEEKPYPTKVEGHPNIWKDPNGRFRWMDETEMLSQESFETIEDAERVLNQYIEMELGPPPSKSEEEHEVGILTDENATRHPPKEKTPEDQHPEVHEDEKKTPKVEDLQHSVDRIIRHCPEPPIKVESRMCPECKVYVDTFISGDTLRYIEHADKSMEVDGIEFGVCNMSEEEVQHVVVTGAPHQEFKARDLVTIQNRTEGSNGEQHLKKSTCPNPTKTVWEVADQMIAANSSATRKEVIETCEHMGIATFTARTQYQLWKKARKESQEHAAQAPTIKL